MQTLPLRPLGASSLTVTPLGIGTAALGRPGYINLGHAEDLRRAYDVAAMRANAHAVFDTAWECGIRYFDAARSYGRAEEFLSTWLGARGLSPGSCTVGSKWGYIYTAAWQVEAEQHERKEHSLAVLKQQLAESMAALDGHLALYQIHSATLTSGVLDNSEVLDALTELRASGTIRAIGLTLSGLEAPQVLRRALELERADRPPFDCVQATWNLLDPSLGPLLAEAHARGMGVIVKEALANGRLTMRNQEPEFAPRRAALVSIAERLGAAIDQIALAYVLAQPWADCVLSGAATAHHVRDNRAACELVLDDEALATLATLAEAPPDYWRKRAALPWG